MSNWNDAVIKEFRENDGRVGGNFEGANLLLLTTTGAKTGHQRVSPMMYFPVSPNTVHVIASKAGTPENPAWFHNLLANPVVEVEQATGSGIDAYRATAEVLPRAERDEAFGRYAAVNPGFAGYQEKTDRVIPVVALHRLV